MFTVTHPRRSYIPNDNPTAVSGSGDTGNQTNSSDAVIHMQEKSAPQVVLRMQLTLHATRRTHHGASRLVLAMSAWSVKTRRAPSRRCKGARFYGHETAAMHDVSISPPPSPFNRCLLVFCVRSCRVFHTVRVLPCIC